METSLQSCAAEAIFFDSLSQPTSFMYHIFSWFFKNSRLIFLHAIFKLISETSNWKTLKPQFAFITRRYKFLLSNLIAFFYLFAFFIPTMFETANDH